jgi:transcriptional regulator GlxA family with amidase domain
MDDRMATNSSMGPKEIADSCGFSSADAMRRTFLSYPQSKMPPLAALLLKGYSALNFLPRL